jgi:regulator of nonsense transcripts 2
MYFNRGAAGKKLDYFLSFFQYYIYTKNPLPMDIEFIVQDIFALTRPQWKLASNLEEAAKAFQLAVAQDQKTSGLDKLAEADDGMSGGSSDEENGDDMDLVEPEDDDESGSEEGDIEAEVCPNRYSTILMSHTNRVRIGQDREHRHSSPEDHDDEDIFVTREQEEVDPEDEADFEREYAKMMAESLESRKFERKQQFDLPLPLRTKTRESSAANDGADNDAEATRGPTMAFSLLTKKGNRQQVRGKSLYSWWCIFDF